MLHRIAFAAALLFAPAAAQAHAVLISSVPPAGGSIPAGPATITLRYNSRIDQSRSRVSLSHDGGPDKTMPLLQARAPGVIRVRTTLAPGTYVLHWFVLATDGHITRGDVPFTAKR